MLLNVTPNNPSSFKYFRCSMQWFGMFSKFVGIHSFTVSVIKIYAMEQNSCNGTKIKGGVKSNRFSIINVLASALAHSATLVWDNLTFNFDIIFDALRDLYTFMQPDWHVGGFISRHPTTKNSSTLASVAKTHVVIVDLVTTSILLITSMHFFLSCWSPFTILLCHFFGQSYSLVTAYFIGIFASFSNFSVFLFNSELSDRIHVGYILRTRGPFHYLHKFMNLWYEMPFLSKNCWLRWMHL